MEHCREAATALNARWSGSHNALENPSQSFVRNLSVGSVRHLVLGVPPENFYAWIARRESHSVLSVLALPFDALWQHVRKSSSSYQSFCLTTFLAPILRVDGWLI
eukprot:3923219-Amphidinium_carterae.1